jgi:hypothetical protein
VSNGCGVLAVVLFLPAVVGCSNSLEATVSGTVTLDSKPIGPGVVTFAPMAGGSNPAVGAIQPNGSYFLKTSRTVGLIAGNYRVAVTVHEQPANAKPGERIMTPSKLLTPQKYANVETSELEFEVQHGKNSIDIPLVSK